MRGFRAVAVAVLLLLAALAQGSVLARLPWPGPGEPQLAALAVLGVALTAGARTGAVAGFGTGLLLDLLPPATHATGQWAFVLCLLGYLAGTLGATIADSLLLPVVVAVLGAALAPVLFTLLGLGLGDPRADLLVAAQRLPAVALWTFVVALLALPVRLLRRRPEAPVRIEAALPRIALAVRPAGIR